jgi:hypothetical protein
MSHIKNDFKFVLVILSFSVIYIFFWVNNTVDVCRATRWLVQLSATKKPKTISCYHHAKPAREARQTKALVVACFFCRASKKMQKKKQHQKIYRA